MPNFLTKITRAFRHHKEMKEMPLRLEFIVTDHCNLNCRGCTHYSSLAPREFADPEKMFSEMAHLGTTCGDEISQVYLIGGETLLYPHLPEALDALRRAFPKQEIEIFTNGLALGKMSDEFWEAVKRNNAGISITRYPIKFDYDKVENLCREKGVRLSVFSDRGLAESFFRFPLDPDKKQNKRLAHFRCFNRGCVSVVDGYVYPCSISACVKHLNKAAGQHFEHLPGDRIAVKEVKSARQIRRLRDRPVPFCAYCMRPEARPYAPSKREAKEWVNL